MNLEIAERGQRENLYLANQLIVSGENLLCRCGKNDYLLTARMSPREIVDAARSSGVDALPVRMESASELSVEEPASVWSAWAQLHYDLGVHEPEMWLSAPALSFLAIELIGGSAQITVTDGQTIGREDVTLGTSVLEGLPVDLAMHFWGRHQKMKFSRL